MRKESSYIKRYSVGGCVFLMTMFISGSYSSTNDIEIDITGSEEAVRSRIIGDISKPPTDPRDYRGLILANDMKVMLISDPLANKAAASLCVASGSIRDPPELPGLAHFTEHMLFLGNEKFPEENDFQKFILEHGGGTPNAITQSDETYYFFRVDPTFLKDALERFAQFFISPLFTESALEREVNAVDSEHQKNIYQDRRRFERVESLTVKEGHPYAKFRTGTLETLWKRPLENSIDIRAALLNFYKEYYSSNLMYLAVLGRENLDDLQKIVEDIFLDVPNRNVSLPDPHDSPYGENELQERIEMVPLGDLQALLVIFPIQYIDKYYSTTSAGYVGHLLGQEGPGSLASLLKGKHWADFVTVGTDVHARGFTNFKVKITLTQQGFNNVDDVVLHIFEYIKMLKEGGPQQWFWEEVRDINKLHFQFSDEIYPIDLVRKLSVNMIKFPMDEIFHSEGAPPSIEYDPQSIVETLDLLTPQNCRVIVTSKAFENQTEEVEEFYEIPYSRKKISNEVIQMWSNPVLNPLLHLPTPNEFIPSEFQLKPRDDNNLTSTEGSGVMPRKLKDTPLSEIWYLQDKEFLLPKAMVKLELLNPMVNESPDKLNLNTLLANLIEESLWEFQYNGNLAGLISFVRSNSYGITIIIKGYDHKLGVFHDQIIDKIMNFKVDLERLEKFKGTVSRLLKIADQEQPCQQGFHLLKRLMWEKYWSVKELLESIQGITLEKMENFSKEFMERLKFRWTFFGNLSPEESLQLANETENKFQTINGTRALFPSQLGIIRTINIPEGSNYKIRLDQKSHSSTCTIVMYQLGLGYAKTSAMGRLLSHMISHSFYDQLRTKEQLGYTVMVDNFYDNDYGISSQGLRFFVQGNHHPVYVESRINSAILDFMETLKNITEAEFKRYKRSVRVSQIKTMEDRARMISREIQSEQFNFNREESELLELDRLTLEEILRFFENNLIAMGKQKRLVVHVYSTIENEIIEDSRNYGNYTVPPSEEILEPSIWKRYMSLYPSKMLQSSNTLLISNNATNN